MKKKVLCVFSLLLYILIVCTMLAEKIEVEMMTQVETKTIKGLDNINTDIMLPSSYLFSENGMDTLFEIEEGTGWKSGILGRKISSQDWQLNLKSDTTMVQLNYFRDYIIICTASRIPQTGELVEIIKDFNWGSDTWLVYFPEGVPEFETLPVGIELIAQNEDSLLLSVENSKFPFFEHRAINYDLNQIDEPGMRVFSLNTVENFLSQIPLLVLIAVLLLIPVLLWAFSCFLSINTDINKWVIMLNVLLVIVSLFALKYVLGCIDLPAAMLPDGNILNLQHYSNELNSIFDNMKNLGAELETETVDKVYNALGAGLAGIISVLILESLSCLLRRRKHTKQSK